jgi:signal peptidase I
MEEEIISFETAKLAKEKGFRVFCDNSYVDIGDKIVFRQSPIINRVHFTKERNGNQIYEEEKIYYACTQSLLQKWLREIHNLHIYIDTIPSFYRTQGSKYKSSIKVPFEPFKWTTAHYYLGNTYENCLEKALQEGLKLIK